MAKSEPETKTASRLGPVTLAACELALGTRTYDLSRHALVMGIVNRTPDSFYDAGRYFNLDDSLRRAEALVNEGADMIDIGGVKAGPGEVVSSEEELERVIPAVEALASRIDVPLSVDTWRAEVAWESFRAGAIIGNDISGFADPDYLAVAATAGATVVATHIRLAPRVADPEPNYPNGDVAGAVEAFLAERLLRAEKAGIARNRVIFDAGLDLGKTAAQSLELLQKSDCLARLGQPLLLSASNKTFLGAICDLKIDERREASLAAAAYGVMLGCRILRVHDVAGTRRVVRMIEALLAP